MVKQSINEQNNIIQHKQPSSDNKKLCFLPGIIVIITDTDVCKLQHKGRFLYHLGNCTNTSIEGEYIHFKPLASAVFRVYP